MPRSAPPLLPRVYFTAWALIGGALVLSGGLVAWFTTRSWDTGYLVMALLFTIGAASAVMAWRSLRGA